MWMQQDELLQPEVEDELGTYNSDIATEFWPGSAPAFLQGSLPKPAPGIMRHSKPLPHGTEN